MNWRSGLLRVWIVLSIAWIVGTGWAFDPIQQIRDANSRPVFMMIDGSSVQFQPGISRPELKAALIKIILSTAVDPRPPLAPREKYGATSTGADFETLVRALRNADAAGDTEAAKALARAIQSLQLPDSPDSKADRIMGFYQLRDSRTVIEEIAELLLLPPIILFGAGFAASAIS